MEIVVFDGKVRTNGLNFLDEVVLVQVAFDRVQHRGASTALYVDASIPISKQVVHLACHLVVFIFRILFPP